MSYLCQVDDISLIIKKREVLSAISLEVKHNQVVCLVGPNGAGKTTLLKAIVGNCRPSRGQIRIKPRVRIGYVPQRIHIDPILPITVARFLQLAGDYKQSRFYERLSLDELLATPLQNISAGQMQRVLLAYALVKNPELLILDEPAQGMDVNAKAWFYHLLGDIKETFGCGVLIASHDLHFVMAATDHVVCLNRHVRCQGHPDSVTTHPDYLELFPPGAERDYAVYVHDCAKVPTKIN